MPSSPSRRPRAGEERTLSDPRVRARLTAGALALSAIAACGGGDGGNGGVAPPDDVPELAVLSGGNNVATRFSSDLWVHGDHVYTGTWGAFPRGARRGDLAYVWRLADGGAPVLADSVSLPGAATVSDIEVSADGALLLVSTEGAGGFKEPPGGGIHLYDLADPEHPVFLDSAYVSSGIHTATFASIAGRRYVFAARNPGAPALLVFDVTDPAAIVRADSVPIPATYGIHDTYVRDGYAFVSAWHAGLLIYDVGAGTHGGSPEAPAPVGSVVTPAYGVPGGPAVHNAWWFHNPATGERRYLFVGQEGPGTVGASSQGNITVVDVSNIAQPAVVASFSLVGAGTHNFWVDEARQILYAAYYNGGVVAIDVSGTLAGDLSSRLLARVRPGGAGGTYVWGVQLANGSLYAIDMLTGLWQLGAAP